MFAVDSNFYIFANPNLFQYKINLMYAIVSIAGQQFKVEKDKKVFVHRLQGDVGSMMEFDKVMLIEDEGKIKIGSPFIKNALVTGKIMAHIKGDKVLVFKKKRKKGYQKMNGHRQYLTEVMIDGILENTSAKKTQPDTDKKQKEVPAASASVAEKAVETVDNATAKKSPQEKKPAVRKVTKSKPEVKTAVKKTAKTTQKAETGKAKAKKTGTKTSTNNNKSEDKAG